MITVLLPYLAVPGPNDVPRAVDVPGSPARLPCILDEAAEED